MTRLLLAGGLLIDGSGAPARPADLLIDDDSIVAVEAPGGLASAAVQRIDISGHVVAPGFIDSHTHDDGYLLVHPEMRPKVSQGVTTVVTGNCGISLAPLVGAWPPQPLDLLGPPDLFRYPTFAAWLQALRVAPPAVNVVPLVGHTTLRVASMADTGRVATADEIGRMRTLLAQALEAGAFGLSSGTFYPPAAAATTDEIIAIGEPMRGCGGIYATHLRDEADGIVPAMHEALAVGRALDCRVVFSHHKLVGANNHGRSVETLALLDAASREQPVCLDCHPYPASSTMLRLDRVRQSERTMITWSDGLPAAAGRDFDVVRRELGLTDDAAVERLKPAGAIYFLIDPADIRRIFAHPLAMVGSDGLPFDRHPHPRQWGTFTRVLRVLVREEGVLTLADAIHRMTGLAADRYGLADRGRVAPGYKADLVVFDPLRVADRATFEDPVQPSDGIARVYVNGRCVWADAATTGARPGRVLRRAAMAGGRTRDRG